MLTKLEIENFKSIYKETIELGRVNVFIGENGCGKTNILEALGMMSAAFAKKLGNDELASKGIRVTKPSITFSSFLKQKQDKAIKLTISFLLNDANYVISVLPSEIIVNNETDILSSWVDKYWGKEITDQQTSNGLRIFAEKEAGLSKYKIYQLSTQILRGINPISREIPGIHGENLDILISTFSKEELGELIKGSYFISWIDDIIS